MSNSSPDPAPWSWPSTGSAQRRYLRSLRLSPEQVTANRSALGKIVFVCHNTANIDVDRVTTCGSVGKGTASSHSADLDLVVYVKGLEPDDMKDRFPSLLDEIQKAVDRQYPETRDLDWHRKFGLRYYIAGMEIDILIGAPHVEPRDFLHVSDPERRQYMSASASHLAKRFIKRQSPLFHDMVRVAKHWRDSFRWDQHCKPKSYLLELIMLDAFRRCHFCTRRKGQVYYLCQPYTSSEMILKKFFELIGSVEHKPRREYGEHNLPPLFIYFETYYDRDELPLEKPEPLFELKRRVGKGRNAKIKTRKATAIVVDPVNPTNNLWLSLGDPTSLINRAKKAAKELTVELD